MLTKLENLTAKLQSALDVANALPEAGNNIVLDKLDNPGDAFSMLEGTEMLDQEGKKVIGTMKNWAIEISGDVSWKIDRNHYAADGSLAIIPTPEEGYHPGGSNKTQIGLTTKTITPTKSSQTLNAQDNGTAYGIITINPISDEYQDVSGVTVQQKYVREGDIFVDANGDTKTGALYLDHVVLGPSAEGGYTLIPVSVRQSGFDLDKYGLFMSNTNLGTADAPHVLEGHTFTTSQFTSSTAGLCTSVATSGTMPNNGAINQVIDGLNTKTVTIPEGYTTGGTVSLDSTIDNTANSQAGLIAQISEALEGKSIEGGATIETCTVNIEHTPATLYAVAYTHLVNGQCETCFDQIVDSINLTLNDIVCNTAIVVWSNNGAGVLSWTTDGDITQLSSMINGGGEQLNVFSCHTPGTATATLYVPSGWN